MSREPTAAPPAEPLVPARCLICRALVWVAPGGSVAGGGPLMFDLVVTGANRMLLVHPCCFEPDDDLGEEDEDWDLTEDEGEPR